jgi:Na+-transporting methylmalonyl-CoA/oxaloacetate decarboxylase gamma subunit
METFTHGLQITAVGMVLVFMSLVIVAALIWALDRIFRPPVVTETPRLRPAPVTAAGPAAPVSRDGSLVDQAAALAVALVLGRQGQAGAQRSGGGARTASVRAPMPWERTVSDEDAPAEGETVTVITVDPGSGNWKSQGRLKAME